MFSFQRPLQAILVPIAGGFICAMTGCGGSGTFTSTPPHISVSLSAPSVSVSQDGMQVVVQISIVSPSETALVSVTGLPGGIKQGYSPSDTNPSGDLTFIGSPAAPIGTYMPTITVSSAGATASTQFTLVVTNAAT
ncbi:MAG: hypothetical protein ABSF53_00820 [Terracidiphilus sp.]